MEELKDHYRTLSGPSSSMYKVKGSKHFAFAYPVSDETEVKQILADLRKEHHSARHHCYAFRLGADGANYRANDDGEPSNSAGKPILGQLEHFELSQTLIVVVRYFGGTKLGVGGLIDAYRTAARAAILAGEIIEKQVMQSLCVHFEYAAINEVMKLFKDLDLPQENPVFDLQCRINTHIRLSELQAFIERFTSSPGTHVTLGEIV